MIDGFQYVKSYGIATAKSYPYIAKRRTCSKDNTTRSTIKVTGYKNVTSSETVLQAAVGKSLTLELIRIFFFSLTDEQYIQVVLF